MFILVKVFLIYFYIVFQKLGNTFISIGIRVDFPLMIYIFLSHRIFGMINKGIPYGEYYYLYLHNIELK